MRCVKLNKLVDVIRSIPTEDKLLTEALNITKKRLEETEDVSCRMLDGSLNSEEKEAEISDFMEDSSVTVLLSTYSVGSEGLRFTVANHVVLLDMWWNFSTVQQAVSRCVGIGQTKQVHYYPIVMANSVETFMCEVCQDKLDEAGWWADNSGKQMYA